MDITYKLKKNFDTLKYFRAYQRFRLQKSFWNDGLPYFLNCPDQGYHKAGLS
jgi:hypothetical protein